MAEGNIGRWVVVAAIAVFFLTLFASINYGPAVVVREVSSVPKQIRTPEATPLAQKMFKRGKAPTILFVVNTHEKNYKTRVQDIRETYLPRIHAKSSLDLIFVSSQMTDGSPDMFQTTCPMGYWEDSCKRADMVTLAAGYLRRPGMEIFDWIFFIDDDAFILPDNVQRVIQKGIEKEKNLTAVFGIHGCVHDSCVGICGGGGYYMNRDTLFHVVNTGNKTAFPSLRDETNFYDKPCGRCGDLTITRAISDFHGVPVKPYPAEGIYVWDTKGKTTEEAYKNSLKMTDPLPWLYHYPARDRFRQFQEWVDQFGSNNELDD
jgi:hypothetical protein